MIGSLIGLRTTSVYVKVSLRCITPKTILCPCGSQTDSLEKVTTTERVLMFRALDRLINCIYMLLYAV